MKIFMMIFRKEKESTIPSPEQMQEGIKQWQYWIGGIVAQERFVATMTSVCGPGAFLLRVSTIVMN